MSSENVPRRRPANRMFSQDSVLTDQTGKHFPLKINTDCWTQPNATEIRHSNLTDHLGGRLSDVLYSTYNVAGLHEPTVALRSHVSTGSPIVVGPEPPLWWGICWVWRWIDLNQLAEQQSEQNSSGATLSELQRAHLTSVMKMKPWRRSEDVWRKLGLSMQLLSVSSYKNLPRLQQELSWTIIRTVCSRIMDVRVCRGRPEHHAFKWCYF